MFNFPSFLLWHHRNFQQLFPTTNPVCAYSCYKYRLSDQHSDQYSDKNINFYLQRRSEHYPLHTQLKTLDKYSLNDSQANRTTKSKTEVHTSGFRPHTRALTRWGDQTPSPSLRISGIYPLRYKTLSTRSYSATATETLPTVDNCPMDREGRPPDIKPFPLLLHTLISFPLLLPLLCSFILEVSTRTNS